MKKQARLLVHLFPLRSRMKYFIVSYPIKLIKFYGGFSSHPFTNEVLNNKSEVLNEVLNHRKSEMEDRVIRAILLTSQTIQKDLAVQTQQGSKYICIMSRDLVYYELEHSIRQGGRLKGEIRYGNGICREKKMAVFGTPIYIYQIYH